VSHPCGPWILGANYNVTTTDDTGTCASPNNDGTVNLSAVVPNFIVGTSQNDHGKVMY